MTDDSASKEAELTLENWGELGIVAHEGDNYVPDSIRRRGPDGGIIEVPITLRIVTNKQRRRSRVLARKWALSTDEDLDLKLDEDLISDMENICILAYAIRDREPPFIQHIPDGQSLAEKYDHQCLTALWARYDTWVQMQHPDFGKYDAEKLWRIIAEVRAGADIRPLAVMPGFEQATCMLLMAREACASPNAPSWLLSSGTST